MTPNQELILREAMPTVQAVGAVGDIAPMALDAAKRRAQDFNRFMIENLNEGEDYGVIPGTKAKSLWLGGAEKCVAYWRLRPQYDTLTTSILDFDKPLFHYDIRCRLYYGDTMVGEGVGSCNSREKKYAWRWVSADDLRNIPEISHLAGTQLESRTPKWQNAQTQFRVPNWEIPDLINTILQMASKRAMVKAVRSTFGLSGQGWTQGMNDPEDSDYGSRHEPAPKTKIFDPPRKQTAPPKKQAAPVELDPVTVWANACAFFREKGAQDDGIDYARTLVCDKFNVPGPEDVPAEKAEEMRQYLGKDVLKDMQGENFIPIPR